MKTITILGREVEMLYCAASETGFEDLSGGKSADVFNPIPVHENGEIKELLPPTATTKDYIYLAIACIVAAAAKKDKEAPDLTKDILYNATSDDIKLLVKTVVELRMEWYKIPTTATIDKMKEDGEEKEKNVDQPATSTKSS